MKEFIGKKISAIRINSTKDILVFNLADGCTLFASAIGDCCSTSWFEHLSGIEALIGHEIIEIVERVMPEQEEKNKYEYIQYYGWTFVTERGRADLEMRNSSNGYYGGYCEVNYYARNQYGIKIERPLDTVEVKEDF